MGRTITVLHRAQDDAVMRQYDESRLWFEKQTSTLPIHPQFSNYKKLFPRASPNSFFDISHQVFVRRDGSGEKERGSGGTTSCDENSSSSSGPTPRKLQPWAKLTPFAHLHFHA